MNEETQEFTTGVDALIDRMKTHPEEFFGDSGRWRFMYKEHFRDVMTESEKGRLHEALKVVRRMEFDSMVVKELMKDEMKEQEELDLEEDFASSKGFFGSAPVKAEGQTVTYDSSNKYLWKNQAKMVKLTSTELMFAKKLGVTPAEYAKLRAKVVK